VLLVLFRASGNISKNALPINAPAEKPMRQKRIFCNNFSFMVRVNIPTNEISETKKVLSRIQIRTMEGVLFKQ
jgi:hypothetical protein